MSKNEIVLYDSPEAAKIVTGISGWADRHGRFWGNGEDAKHLAQWSGCTHMKCECGNIMEKRWIKCESCREKQVLEKFQAMPRKDWDGEGALYSAEFDKFFFSWDEVFDFAREEDCETDQMQLIICEPVPLTQIETDFWEGDLPEDGELPDEVVAALDKLNRAIDRAGPVAWEPGSCAVAL